MARPQAHDPAGPEGHAIEVRLYAEDPVAGYQPQSGRLTTFDIPVEDGIRVDAGFESGSVVSTHYDAMLAKVVAHAPTRSEAARKLAGVLARARIHGVVTNRDQLVQVLRDERFLAGEVSTAFLDGRASDRPAVHPDAAVAAAIGVAERARTTRTVQRGVPVAWRNVTSQPQRTTFVSGDGAEERVVEWFGGRAGYRLDGAAVVAVRGAPASSLSDTTDDTTRMTVVLERDGVRSAYDLVVAGLPGREVVDVDSAGGHARLTRVPRFTDPAAAVASGSLLAPMPGTVVSVAVAKGDAVAAGQPVLVLEAMKMQHTVSAPQAGVVDRIDVEPGAQVAAGEVLAVVAGDPAPEEES
jgi:propionyl-CoA carboxylase alpha chain